MNPNPLIEGMRERLECARERLTKAQQAFQIAQAELQAATGEYNVWNAAITLLAREEERRQLESKEQQLELPEVKPVSEKLPIAAELDLSQSAQALNQTEKVREIIRLHDAGITAGGIWRETKDYVSSRPYLYSILKRLRDNDSVCLRRGKYLIKVKPDAPRASESEAIVIQ